MSDSHDRRVLRRMISGDPRALAELYDRHASLLALRLRQGGASKVETEDLLQETFLEAWQCAGSFRGDGAVAAWLWGIAKNKSAMMIRTAVRARGRESAAAARLGDPPPDESAWATSITAVGALEKMNPDIRAAFEAVVVDGMTTIEAAKHLDVPEGTIKSRVHRARAAIREETQ